MGTRPASKAARIGRTGADTTPVAVVGLARIDPGLGDYVRERLGFKLGKFAERVTRITVRFVDHSGPKGATAIGCRVSASLVLGSTATVESRHSSARGAFDQAADAHERAVRRLLDRRSRVRPAR